MRSSPSLPLLSGSLQSGEIAFGRVLSVGPIELHSVLMLNRIV